MRLCVKRSLATQTEPAGRMPVYRWFSTPQGQKFVGFTFIAGSVALAAGHMAPHTLLLAYVKDFFQQYTGGLPAKVRSVQPFCIIGTYRR